MEVNQPLFYRDEIISPNHWIFCGFESCCTIICYCGRTFHDLNDLTLEETTKRIFTHLHQIEAKHAYPLNGIKPGKEKILQFLVSIPGHQILARNAKCLVAKEQTMQMDGLGYLRTIGFGEIVVQACLHCLQVKRVDYKTNLPCCSSQNMQQITYFGRGLSKINRFLIVDTSTANTVSIIPTSSPTTSTSLIQQHDQVPNSSSNNNNDYELVVDEETPTYLVIEKISRSAGATDSRDRVYLSQSNNSSSHQSYLTFRKKGFINPEYIDLCKKNKK